MIKEISITDIRWITQMVLRPSALNILQGDNGEGKTTIIMAIQAAFEGGHRPTLRRRLPSGAWAKKGEIKLVLEDGTTILRTIREKTSDLTVTQPNGMEVPSPQDFVETLASGFSFDPIAFVEAKPRERLAYLQRALNISFEPEEVYKLCGLKPAKAVDLDGLNLIRKQAYDARTKENTLARQAEGTADRLSSALAEDESTNWVAEAASLQNELDAAVRGLAAGKDLVRQDADKERERINRAAEDAIADINRERTRKLEAVRQIEAGACQDVENEVRPDLDRLTAAVATAQERARKAAHDRVLRQEIDAARLSSDAHKGKSAELTAAIDGLDRLKAEKLESVPIPGLDIRDGEFWCGDLPFDDLNTGEKYMRSFQIGALSPNQLGVMLADKAEHLGPANWQAFQDAALASGFQVFVTRVTGTSLDIQLLDPEPESLVSA